MQNLLGKITCTEVTTTQLKSLTLTDNTVTATTMVDTLENSIKRKLYVADADDTMLDDHAPLLQLVPTECMPQMQTQKPLQLNMQL